VRERRNREAKASEQSATEWSGRNEGEPHQMSSEMVEPENQSNRWRGGEDCQGPTGQRSEGDHCSGGVGADGMNRSETKAKREVSHHGESKPQPTGQAGTTGKTAGVEGDGRVLRSSDDPPGSKHGGEPREGTCLNVDQRSQAPEDGRGEGEYLFDRITTPPKCRSFNGHSIGKQRRSRNIGSLVCMGTYAEATCWIRP